MIRKEMGPGILGQRKAIKRECVGRRGIYLERKGTWERDRERNGD